MRVLLLAAWLVLGLIGHDPWKPDEAYTFGVVYHAVDKGEWLVPMLTGEPFVEKPPLLYWTAALFAKALGDLLPLHDAARLASGFYAALALLFTWLLADRRIGAPLLLAGCLGYLQHAHQLIPDNALVAGVAIGLYGLRESRGWVLGIGAGIAFLAKGLLGPGLLGVIALLLPLLPAWRASWRSWPSALLVFAPFALIWPVLLYWRSPALFHEWFWVNNIGRFDGSAGLGGARDHLLYAKALAWFALPAWPLALWAVLRRPGVPEVQLGFVAFLVMLGVLSAASSARTLYAVPMLVPLTLLATSELYSAPAWLTWPLEKLAVAVSALAGLALWAAWLAFLVGWRPGFLVEASPGFVPHLEPILVAAAIALTAFWVYSFWLEPVLPVRWLAGVTLVWGLAMTLWLPWLDYTKSYRGVIMDMQAHRPKVAGCVASRNLTEPQRAMLQYFAGLLTEREKSPQAASCPLLLVHSSGSSPPDVGAPWQLAWRGTRPGDAKEFFWLFAHR